MQPYALLLRCWRFIHVLATKTIHLLARLPPSAAAAAGLLQERGGRMHDQLCFGRLSGRFFLGCFDPRITIENPRTVKVRQSCLPGALPGKNTKDVKVAAGQKKV